MNYYVQVFKNFWQFSGRSQRAEYWYFVLFNLLIEIILAIVDNTLGTEKEGKFGTGIFIRAFALAIIIPGFSVMTRRLHDIGKSGWWILLQYIPIVGTIWFVVLMATAGQPGDNQYSRNPIEKNHEE